MCFKSYTILIILKALYQCVSYHCLIASVLLPTQR